MDKYTQEKISILQKNVNVEKVEGNSIFFKKEFKVLAVKEYNSGMKTFQIFRDAGFDLDIIGKETIKYRLKHWVKVHKKKGDAGLLVDYKNTKKGDKVTSKKRIEYLEAEVEYLKSVNDFLVKLRVKKAE